MDTQSQEEVWFSRIVLILGARELVDALTNAFAILKVRSGLPISFQVDENLAIALGASSFVTGLYIALNGALFSRLAYGRSVPAIPSGFKIELPDTTRCVSLAFRGFGAYQIIQGGGYLARVLALRFGGEHIASTILTHSETVYMAWTLEHVLLGVILLFSGGRLASALKLTRVGK